MNAQVAAVLTAVSVLAGPALARGQSVTREEVAGVANFARVETTVACAGATRADAVPNIKRLGFASIINLRQANEPGAEIEKEADAAKAAGINWVHIPFNAASPAPDLVDRFLAAVNKPENQPAFIHCAGGGRAASLWMIKRVQVDHWDEQRAYDEATALGMSGQGKVFALEYVKSHKR